MNQWRAETIIELEAKHESSSAVGKVYQQQSTLCGILAIPTSAYATAGLFEFGGPAHMQAYFVIIPLALAFGWRVNAGKASDAYAEASRIRERISRLQGGIDD